MKIPFVVTFNNRRARSSRRWLFIMLLFVMVAIIFIMRHGNSGARHVLPVTTSAMTITSASAAEVSWPDTLEASGPITAWQEAIIGSQISGQALTEVLVNVGDNVKKGQVLARYNTDMLLAQKAELQANWVQAEADRKRALTLKKTGAMSTQIIESYVNKAAVAKARLDAKNLEIQYAVIVAPDDGVISSRTATLGAIGNPGSELFRMILQNRFEWRGELTAQQLRNIHAGQIVKLALPDGSEAQAKIRDIAPSFNVQSRMATVYADIIPGSHAQAGMYVDGTIEMGNKQVITVPAESVIIRDGYSYVFTLPNHDKSSTVQQTEVTAGRHLGNKIEIVTGLQAGAQVAEKGAGFLKDGDHVQLVTATEIHT